MTTKLYYEDAYMTSFSSCIMKSGMNKDGHPYVVLEQTAFYPTGGGQPHDTGTVNGVPVINVEEVDGDLRHYLQSPLPSGVTKVDGTIDWERRFDHMQQHQGQHILSAAFAELFHIRTIGFHMGSSINTIDLDVDQLTIEMIGEVERLANRIIYENRDIEVKWVQPDELSLYPLRKNISVDQHIRLVIIPDFDYNGCGGTHPLRTGEVGAIKIIDWERYKNGIRLQFACGKRVIQLMEQQRVTLKQLRQKLNSNDHQLPEKADQLLSSLKDLEKLLTDKINQLLHFEAKEIWDRDRVALGDMKLILREFEGRSLKELQQLAELIVAEDDEVVIGFVTTNEAQIQVLCARGKQVKMNMSAIIKQALIPIEGKGGGSPAKAQGGGKAVLSGREMLTMLEELISRENLA